MMEWGICAHGGVSRQEADALGATLWHNWGTSSGSPQGAGHVGFVSLRGNLSDIGPRYQIIGNEPENADQDNVQDPEQAGTLAGVLVNKLYSISPQTTPVVLNTLRADLVWQAAYVKALQAATRRDFTIGLHVYGAYRPDPLRIIDAAEDAYVLHERPVLITECGVLSWSWDEPWDREFFLKLAQWQATYTYIRGLIWAQWPTRWAASGLYREGKLTELGQLYRAATLWKPEPNEPPVVSGDKWETLKVCTWPMDGYIYQATVERRRA